MRWRHPGTEPGPENARANYWHGDFPWRARRGCAPVDPRGGDRDASLDPRQAPVPRKVVKGGSFLCADSYLRYRPSARRPQLIDTGMSHIGFRCAAALTVPLAAPPARK